MITINGNQVLFETVAGQAARADAASAGSNPLQGMTLADVLGWIDTNMTDLASARVAFKQIAKILWMFGHRIKRLEDAS